MDGFFPQQMPPPLPGWDGAPMGFNGGLGMGGLPMGMGMNGAGAFGGMMGEQQHPGPYIPFPSTSFAPFGGEGEMAGTGTNMGMDGQFGGFDVNGFRLPNSLPSRPSDSPTSLSFPNGNGNGHFEGPTFNNAEAGPSNSHFADYVFHPDANQNHDHNNSGQDDSGNTYVDFHGFVRNKPFDKANIQPIKNFDNITIHFAAANPQHPNKIGVTYEPSQSTRGLFPVQSTFVPSTTPVPPRRPSSSSTPTSPALSPPDPSTTLVMEMIPRKFRTKALIYKWLENVDGCPMPKRVEVEGGKALIEFWGRDMEWARRVFGSQRMAGNDGLGSVRVWWWKGYGKGGFEGLECYLNGFCECEIRGIRRRECDRCMYDATRTRADFERTNYQFDSSGACIVGLEVERSRVPAEDEDEDSPTLRSGGSGTGTFYTIRFVVIALTGSAIEGPKRKEINRASASAQR